MDIKTYIDMCIEIKGFIDEILLEKRLDQIETKLLKLEKKMANFLSDIGETHFKAAMRALEDQSSSKKPTREIESAITSLREAFEHFKKADEDLHEYLFAQEKSEYRKRLNPKPAEGAYRSSMAISLCYYVLGEKSLAKKYLKEFNLWWDEWARKSTFYNEELNGKMIPWYYLGLSRYPLCKAAISNCPETDKEHKIARDYVAVVESDYPYIPKLVEFVYDYLVCLNQ